MDTDTSNLERNIPHWQTWEVCRVCPLQDHNASACGRETVTLANAFDTALLNEFCRKNNTATFRVFQLAWAVVISTYVGTDEVCAGIVPPVRGGLPSIYRCKLDRLASIADLLENVEEQSIELDARSGSLSDRLEQVALSTGIFDTVLSSVYESPQQPGSPEANESTKKYEQTTPILRLYLPQRSETIAIHFPTPAITHFQAKSMIECFSKTILGITTNAQTILGELDLISSWDLAHILKWNKKNLFASETCIHHVLESQARLRPKAPAICSWDGNYTHGELDDMSSRLAQHLRKLGVGRDVIVPFHFRKSAWTVVAMLATMKAGGAPVGLNWEFPLDRLQYIIRVTKARIILAGRDLQHVFEDENLMIVVLDHPLISTLPPINTDTFSPSKSSDAAFVLFTSGSTGQPKGIVIEHGQYCASAFAQHGPARYDQNSRSLQFAAHSFDSIFSETFSPLMAGGCVCIPSEEQRMNNLAGAINDMHVTRGCLTPTLAKIISPSDVPGLQTMAICGETASRDVIDLWADHKEFLNIYGPAECSVIASINSYSRESRDPNNIGKGLQAMNFWIVRPENHNRLSPIGALGELVIEGPTVGRGYLYDDEKTAAAFLEGLPWLKAPTQFGHFRAYKTGDLVRYTPDGSLEFVGRNDSQIKLRGVRIELSEISFQINAHSTHGSAAAVEVIRPAFRPSQQILVAFLWSPRNKRQWNNLTSSPLAPFTADIEAEMLKLKQKLSQVLPESMVPSVYLPLTCMPVNPSGKTDRKMLRSLASNLTEAEMTPYSSISTTKRAVRTGMERCLQLLWASVLKIDAEEIRATDNFVWIGGDSVTAMRLAVAARAENIVVSVADILRYPQLCELASVARVAGPEDRSPYQPFSSLPFLDVGNPRTGLWGSGHQSASLELDDIEDASEATDYQASNVAWMLLKRRGGTNFITLDFEEPLCPDRLEAACHRLVAHHGILRTTFLVYQRRVLQVVLKKPWLSIAHHDCSISVQATTKAIVEDDLRQHMRLGEPIVKMMFLEVRGKVKRLIVRASHAQYDGHASLRICKDLAPSYLGQALVPYSSFAEYMHFASNVQPERAESFWRDLLKGADITRFLQHTRPPHENVCDGAIRKFIPTTWTRPRNNITAATTVKAAWAVVCAELSGSTDVVFGSVTWGRNASFSGVENVVGPCIGHIPVRIQIHRSGMTILDLLETVQDQYVSAIPYETFGVKRIIDRCTSWPCWERMSSLLLFQNLDDSSRDMSIDGNRIETGEIRPPADRADITIYAQPNGEETMIELNYCTNVIAALVIEEILERLCELIETFNADVHALLPFKRPPEGATPRIPFKGDDLVAHAATNGHAADQIPNMHVATSSIPSAIANSKAANKTPMQIGVLISNLASATSPENGATTSNGHAATLPSRVSDDFLEQIVASAWTDTFGCLAKDLERYREEHTPYFEIWGHLAAAAALSTRYSSHGFVVEMEDVLENPTMERQIGLLRSVSPPLH